MNAKVKMSKFYRPIEIVKAEKDCFCSSVYLSTMIQWKENNLSQNAKELLWLFAARTPDAYAWNYTTANIKEATSCNTEAEVNAAFGELFLKGYIKYNKNGEGYICRVDKRCDWNE